MVNPAAVKTIATLRLRRRRPASRENRHRRHEPVLFTWDVSSSTPSLLTDGALTYIYGPQGLPVGQVATNGDTSYFVHDQLGSTRLVLRQDGTALGAYSFDAYGSTTSATNPSATPVLYAGAYRDAESGLYYLIHRYDSTVASYLSVDHAMSLTHERYEYADDHPVDYIDPLGLSWYKPWTWSTETWKTVGEVAGTVSLAAGLTLLCVALVTSQWGRRAPPRSPRPS
jgi:RHS repeat-associated protein